MANESSIHEAPARRSCPAAHTIVKNEELAEIKPHPRAVITSSATGRITELFIAIPAVPSYVSLDTKLTLTVLTQAPCKITPFVKRHT